VNEARPEAIQGQHRFARVFLDAHGSQRLPRDDGAWAAGMLKASDG